MISLYKPKIDDLWFRRQMLADEATMSYNHAYDGTIDFSENRWEAWFDKWVEDVSGKHFYRYVKLEDGTFVGEASYHFDETKKRTMIDVIIYAPYRREGYGREAIKLICDAAKENGIDTLYDEIAIDNSASVLFKTMGFTETERGEYTVTLKRELDKSNKDGSVTTSYEIKKVKGKP